MWQGRGETGAPGAAGGTATRGSQGGGSADAPQNASAAPHPTTGMRTPLRACAPVIAAAPPTAARRRSQPSVPRRPAEEPNEVPPRATECESASKMEGVTTRMDPGVIG